MTRKSLGDGFSDSYLKDTIEKEGRERKGWWKEQGTDTSLGGRTGGGMVKNREVMCKCVLGRWAHRNKNSRSRADFLIQVLKMCWSRIFWRVLGWKKKLCHSGLLVLYPCCMTEMQALGDDFVMWMVSAIAEAAEPSRVCVWKHVICLGLKGLCCWVTISISGFTLKDWAPMKERWKRAPVSF